MDHWSSGKGISPFPFGVIFPQDEHEQLLVARLEAAGVHVARGTTIESLDEEADGIVRARGKDANGPVAFTARFVAGCDGARSAVRAAIGAGFPGGTYEHLFYVADVTARGGPMNDELHIMLDDAGFLGLFPLAGEGRARLVRSVQNESSGKNDLRWEDVDRRPIDRIGLHIEHVNWFSTYRVHHRVADTFRRGRAFLLGDAGHIHSPVGGQGMNTGLGDAMNLAWKLAAVLGGRAKEDLLDTYEPERIAFARRLVATTDRVFSAASSESRLAEVVRTELLPRLLPPIIHTRFGQHLAFAAVSQTGIEYRDGPWSEGRAGTIHAGDRLPWVAPARAGDRDNFTPLESLDWQLHVYGAPGPELRAACDARDISVHVFPFDSATRAAHFERDAAYLVRPDGYLGAVTTARKPAAKLAAYLDTHGIRGRRSIARSKRDCPEPSP